MKKQPYEWGTLEGRHSQIHFAHAAWRQPLDSPFGEQSFQVLTVEEEVSLHDLPAIIEGRLNQVLRFKRLEERVADLEEQAARNVGSSKLAVIQSFAPEMYEPLRPISVMIEPSEDGFLATWFDANIGTSGETEQEAFENLKSLILDVFDSLNRERPEKLGPEPRRQLAVLRSLIRAT